ncbi:MAG: DMT family transporter, partial [Rhodospirillales bacterium]|nr:DMT family transporter [Rhodospirillales bacterium]
MLGKSQFSHTGAKNLQGMLWMMLGSALFSINFAVIRHLGQDLHPFEIVFFRNLFGLLVFIPWLIRAEITSLKPNRPMLLGGRACIQVVAQAFWYASLMLIPLADATALGLVEPIIAAFLAILILREKSTFGRWAVVFIGFIGSLIIVRPGFQDVSIGALYAVLSSVTWAGFALLSKVLTKTDSTLVVVAYPTALVVPLALIPALFVWEVPSLANYGWLIVTGSLASTANFALTKAFKMGDITAVSPIGFTRLLFSAAVGFIV